MDTLVTKTFRGKRLAGDMNRGITYNEFVETIKDNPHIVIDLRPKHEIEEKRLSNGTFEMDADDIPTDPNYIPSYFKENYVVVICSDGSVSKKGVENFFEQDNSLTKMFYIVDGHNGVKE